MEVEYQQQLLQNFLAEGFSHIVSNTYFLAQYLTADIEAFQAVCHFVFKDEREKTCL
ncbi:hypothetical protein [Lysinibacillus sphaericus]|uniref:hypothetical protein n=1 Tax=Lysinibacillus sphaericus TaxID=1421 RepID=UPI0003A0FE5E|nr:hypothetical protein [Lysinibacillus sphaericus]